MRRARLGLDLFLLLLAMGMGLWAWQSRRGRAATLPPEAEATPAPARIQQFIRDREQQQEASAALASAPQGPGADGRAGPPNQAPRREPTPPPPAASGILNVLVIQLVDPEGLPFLESAQVFSLDRLFTETVHGGRLVMQMAPGPCTVQAQYLDAGLIQRSREQRVVLPENAPAAVTLVLPRPSRGDAGMRLAPREGYAEILGVRPGGVAEALGLRDGDAVLAIDGQAVDGLAEEDLDARLSGRPYEAVDLLVVVRNDLGQFEEHNLRLLRGRAP